MAKPSTFVFVAFLFSLISFNNVSARPLTYALCNVGWCTCSATIGLTTGGVALPAIAIACNIVQGVCMTSCTVSFFCSIP
ncbi:hypothetical protein Glove_102g31 [Diversispora epigaea]|uniref:Hydrophobin n=1 Tax=Diversispora epigaea TaxID=1348612 RepID=A0A397J4B6_9GLOM|nr:hypothetical protein Glove_102g31 [Diversispora epigaea]